VKAGFRKEDNFTNMHQSNGQKPRFSRFGRMSMDEDIKAELASIRNLLTEVLVNQDILAKRINADTAIKAVQTERAVELARLRRTADKAMKVSA